jgi:small-conductance mechanosensitive channel
MQSGQSIAGGAAAAAQSGIAPLDAFQRILDRSEAEFLAALAAVPGLPGALWGVLPTPTELARPVLGQSAIIALLVALTFVLVRRLTSRWRGKAAKARSALAGMAALAGLELLALVAAGLVGRVLLVRWLGLAPGAAGLPTESTIALVRWLMGLTLAWLVFQPQVRRFRLAAVDDVGAAMAVRRIMLLLTIGHAHMLLLDGAQRAGLGLPYVKLLSSLVAAGMAAGAIGLFGALRRHGASAFVRQIATALTLATLLLWAWGWIALDFNLYRGAVGTVVVLVLALALDRAIAISIRDSRRPEVMRRLFVLRVVVDALAAMLIVRIVVEFWLAGALGLISAEQWPGFARRLSFASFMLVLGVTLAAIVHVWTEAKLTPPAALTAQEREYRLARLSTVLPMVRFAVIALIGVVFSLVALSALGIDITPLMAGAGIIGLAISFGSQTLVKDIVSGIFYMLDDVFRLGEIIETGSRTGRLEQIHLRSVRLRDEAGRLHTIPLGELGTITNHSRRLVRVSIALVPAGPVTETGLARFARKAVAALRSEPMIHAAIVGDVAMAQAADEAGETTIRFSFSMASATADHAREPMRKLVEEAAEDAGLALAQAQVVIEDLSAAPPAAPAEAAPAPATP